MFCTSLRKRPEWATVPNILLSSQNPRWQEKSLTAHDIAIPFPQFQHDSLTVFHLLALSPSDLETSTSASAMERIQHMHHYTGGRNVGILFLLNENKSTTNGTIALMNLQISLLHTLETPIIPLFSLTSLIQTLSTFQQQLTKTRLSTTPPPPLNPAISLLPYCTNNPPLPEHARNVISDVCHSLAEVSHAATSPDGQLGLKEYLDETVPGAVEDIVNFWGEESLVD